MQLSVSSGKNGILQRATFLAFGDSTDHTASWPLADMIASANQMVHKIATRIIQASGTWQFDDSNQTDLPVATTTLVNDQEDYSLPTTAIEVTRIEVKDINGIWSKLTQIDQSEVPGSLTEFMKTSGVPTHYDITGNSVILYPAPDTAQVTASAGLKIFYARESTTFTVPASYTTADTTQPGFSESFHDTVAKGIAYDWCLSNGPDDRATRLRQEIEIDLGDLKSQIGMKNKDKKVGIRVRPRTGQYR